MADPALSLGKPFGVEIQLHWTFILILLVAALFGIFTFIVILFVMVFFHELAHSLTSKYFGIKVKRIILIPLGGASIIDLDEATPSKSFWIALAGPTMSVLLGVVFGILYLQFPMGMIGNAFELLFLINILLGISNLFPAFPLDGGRMLKSYLQKTNDQFTATRKTVKVSRIMLILYLILSTIYIFLLNYSPSNIALFMLWNVVIAVFIYGGAQSELQAAYITKYAAKLKVSSAVNRHFIEVKSDTRLRALYKTFLKKGVIPVLFKKKNSVWLTSKLVADPSRKDISQFLSKKVSDYAVEVPAIDYEASLAKAIDRMRYEESSIVAVLKNKKIYGIIYAEHVESILALSLEHTKMFRESNK